MTNNSSALQKHEHKTSSIHNNTSTLTVFKTDENYDEYTYVYILYCEWINKCVKTQALFVGHKQEMVDLYRNSLVHNISHLAQHVKKLTCG